MTKASDLFVAALEAEGVTHVFGVPGEENLDFLDSLSRSNITFVLTRHEQSAGFMAATCGRFTGQAAVALATLGPGACNLVTAAAYATLGGMPMVMVTGQKPIRRSKQGRFQILDVINMMAPLTKYTHQVASAQNLPARIREAFRLAEEEKPGATHLELPEDIAAEEADVAPIPDSLARRPIAEEKAVSAAVERLENAKTPILVIGAGANRKRASRMLTRLIDRTGIPFVTTQLGKGVVDERHERFLGCAALSDGDFVHRALEAADLIVNIGHDVIEKPPFFMEPGGTDVIHLSYTTAEVDPVYFPQYEVVGDVANAVWQISERLEPSAGWDFARIDEVKRHHDANIAEGADAESFPVTPRRLVADVRRVMPSDGIVCLDNGIYKIWFARNYLAHQPNTVLLDNALATMGAGLPSAMAARLVYPDRKVIAVCGDGGFMMNAQELETAVRLKMNLVCLVLNDAAYGMIRWKQEHEGFADFGLSYANPDLCAFAEAHGAHGHEVRRTEDLQPLLERCLDSPGVHLIDCPVDYSDNVHLLHHAIPEAAAAI